METIKLDNFDLKLISELENNARLSLSKIAKKLRTSQQAVSYRMKSLEERGIIGGYYSIINISKFDYTIYRNLIRLSNITDKKHKEIINYLMKNGNVLWLVDCGGKWDLLVNFMAKNIVQYSELIRTLKNKFPNQIQNYDVLTIVEVIYFGRDYFINKNRNINQSIYFIGAKEKTKSEKLELDETNLKILSIISENARLNSAEIANKIKVSPNTIILRMKELQKNGIIQGYKPLIHLDKTSYKGYKALIKFQNITDKKEKELIEYVNNNINIVGVIRIIGAWDLEIEFEIETQDQMIKITRDIRDKFKDIIKEFELLPLYHEYRYNFFPRDLLKKETTKDPKTHLSLVQIAL